MAEPDAARYRLAFEGLLGDPFTEGNRIDVLRNGCRIFPPMLEAIAGAESSIELLTFVYWKGDIADRFAEALAERARAGVEVKLLLDAYGAKPMPRHLVERMEGAGVEVRWFRPLVTWRVWSNDNRTHRKVMVVDGRVGFTGGVGIAAEWEGDARNENEWRDTHFRIVGPAVHGLQAAFYGNWIETTGAVGHEFDNVMPADRAGPSRIQVVRATAAIGWSDIATMLQTVVAQARSSLRIVTPYLAPDEVSTGMLARAAERGVRIEIMLPGPHTDKRVSQLASAEQLEQLLEAGIILWRFQPAMIHAKVVLLDGVIACIGSGNFNHRSMLKDEEVALVTDCPETIATLNEHFDDDVKRCECTDMSSWRRRSTLRRAIEAVAHVIRPQT